MGAAGYELDDRRTAIESVIRDLQHGAGDLFLNPAEPRWILRRLRTGKQIVDVVRKRLDRKQVRVFAFRHHGHIADAVVTHGEKQRQFVFEGRLRPIFQREQANALGQKVCKPKN